MKLFRIFAELKIQKREMAETRRTTRVPKATKTKPVDEYGHLQPQAPEGCAGSIDD
jgi:replicative DNA helicase